MTREGAGRNKSGCLKGCLIVVALCVVLVVFGCIMLFVSIRSARKTYEKELAKLKAAGEPMKPGDCAPKPILADENGAPQFKEAVSRYTAVVQKFDAELQQKAAPAPSPSIQQILTTQNWSAAETDAVRGFLSREDTAEVQSLLREGASKPRSQWPLDYSKALDINTWDLCYVLDLTNLACAEVRLKAMDGNGAAAADLVPRAVRVARAVEEEKLADCVTKTVECETAVSDTVRFLLDVHDPTPDELRRMEQALRPSGNAPGLADVLRMQRATHLSILTTADDPVKVQEFVAKMADEGAASGPGGKPAPSGKTDAQAQRDKQMALSMVAVSHRFLRPLLHSLGVQYLQNMEKAIANAEKPNPQAWQENLKLAKQCGYTVGAKVPPAAQPANPPQGGPMALLVFPLVAELQHSLLERDVQRDTLRIELALRAYWQVNGKWPDKLEDLVPEFLPELPKDPFTGLDYQVNYRNDKPQVERKPEPTGDQTEQPQPSGTEDLPAPE